MNTDMSSLKVNGYPVFYEKIGSGPNPVLLIPGEIGILIFNKITLVILESFV